MSRGILQVAAVALVAAAPDEPGDSTECRELNEQRRLKTGGED